MTTTLDYVYCAERIEKVTDGDTFWLHLDIGFRQSQLTQIRLFGYDTPERTRGSEFEKTEAKRARLLAETWLTETLADESVRLLVRTEKDPDNFGRWLGHVWRESVAGDVPHVLLGDTLRAERLASIWPIRWHEEFDV